MYDNGRPPILMSQQPYPAHYEPGERKNIVCPQCRTMRRVKQNLIVQHDAADGLADCAGSFQRVVFDVTEQQERELRAARAAGLVPGHPHAGAAAVHPAGAARWVADVLRTRIRTGRLRPGEHLLPVEEIARQLRVDQSAALCAVQLLHDEHLLSIGPGGAAVSIEGTALAAQAAAQRVAPRVRESSSAVLAVHQLAAARTVADVLRLHIRTGRLAPGQRLPPVRELARLFQITEIAVRHALTLLHDQQLLATSPGNSVFVSTAAPRLLVSAA